LDSVQIVSQVCRFETDTVNGSFVSVCYLYTSCSKSVNPFDWK